MESVYDLYQRGCELLEHGDYQAAIVPLSKARDLEPDKASIREALGRALFHAQRYEGAAEEFEAVAHEHADQRLRAVLPRSLDAAARAPPRGPPAARAGLLAAPRARGLRLPRPRRRDANGPDGLAGARSRASGSCPLQGTLLGEAARCYPRSTAFVPARRAPAAVPKVGARPLFLRKGCKLDERTPGRYRTAARAQRARGRGAARRGSRRALPARVHRPPRRRHARAVRARDAGS